MQNEKGTLGAPSSVASAQVRQLGHLAVWLAVFCGLACRPADEGNAPSGAPSASQVVPTAQFHDDHDSHILGHDEHGHEHDDHGDECECATVHDEAHESEAGHGHAHPHDQHGHSHGDGPDDHAGAPAEIRLSQEAIQEYGVRLMRAERRELRPTLKAPAQIAFNAEAVAHVGSPLAGRIVEIPVRLGDPVGRGDLLAVIESPELGEAQSEFLQRRILAEAAQAGAELAASAASRARGLFEQSRGISLDDVQKREIEHQSAQAALFAARAASVAAESKLRLLGMFDEAIEQLRESATVDAKFRITAPIAGRIVEREITLGELVRPETEALLVIADTTTLWVIADAPETRLPEIRIGNRATFDSVAGADHPHVGRVSYISPTVDPRTRTAQVRISVECEHGALWPGMFVEVNIELANAAALQPVIAIPEAAIQNIDGQPCVFAPAGESTDTFTVRPIRLGRIVNGLAVVEGGLAEGETFVGAGSFILKAEREKHGAEHHH